MRPLFTIITVTYNAEALIERTIQSILGQTYDNLEYVIVDGASTDGTMDIVKKYKDSHLTWRSEPDNGIYDAMNKALNLATGDYVWFINAGDTIHDENTLERLADGIPGKILPDVIYGETAIANANGHIQAMRRLKAPAHLTWKSFRMGMLVCHQSFIAKRVSVPDFDLTYKYSADYEWCIQCLKKARLIHNTHQILSVFLDGGVSTTQRKASLKERFIIMKKHYGSAVVMLLHLWFAVRFFFAKWTGRQV